MTKELVIGSNRHETKVAILENDKLVEVYFQRANEYSLAGSIHKGRVTRVLPGMQSAFVDLGLERDTFLYVSDFFEENEDIEPLEDKPARGGHRRSDRGGRSSEARQAEPAGPDTETAEIETEGISSAEVAADEAAATVESHPEGERSPREHRGRRSRRRRSRGRGFPESKYAQTPAPQPASSEHAEPDAADVLILPGESLAKYQNASGADDRALPSAEAASISEQNAAESDDTEIRAWSVGDQDAITPEEPESPDSELEREAEEIETTDRVFDHHPDDEPPEAEDQKFETVREDQPADDIAEAEAAAEIPAAELPSEISEAVPEAVADSSEPAQTATHREQGARFLHRVSRRMRRRRNRFGHAGGEGSEALGGNGAAGAAPALETEARRDPQEHAAERPDRPLPSITDLLKPGQEIIVQIAKEPLGQKGARITSHIALPGRYVVYMPTVSHLGVSRRIASEQERHRLKRILQTHRSGATGGFIVRTAGEGVPEKEIAADMNILYNLWLDIRQKAEKEKAPALLHHDLDIVYRVLRDQLTDEFKAVWVDSEDMYEKVLDFLQKFQPALVSRVKMYTRPAPIFDAFNITQELEKALRPKVWLKSGGYIVINQTEALVAIDINTGKYVGKSNRLEDTIVKTNLEAVDEIVRQIRLRDLGGIIVVDFIDMDERKNRQKIMQALEEAMRADKAPYKVLQFNDFGLVAITRKRVKQSLERTLCSPCPYCEAAGYVKSVQTIIGEILVEAQKVAPVIESKDAVLRVNPEVAKVLKARDNEYLEELEETLKRPVLVQSDPGLHHEKFDLT